MLNFWQLFNCLDINRLIKVGGGGVPLRHSCVHQIHTQAQWRRWDRGDSFHQET